MNPQNKTAPIDRKAIIEQCFTAYNAKDRATIEGLLTSTFTFTSPYDDAIDRATYFQRCWSMSDRIRVFYIRG
jgi:hypothetical protein